MRQSIGTTPPPPSLDLRDIELRFCNAYVSWGTGTVTICQNGGNCSRGCNTSRDRAGLGHLTSYAFKLTYLQLNFAFIWREPKHTSKCHCCNHLISQSLRNVEMLHSPLGHGYREAVVSINRCIKALIIFFYRDLKFNNLSSVADGTFRHLSGLTAV